MRKIDGENLIFVYLPDWGNEHKWWVWNVHRMRLSNYNSGGFDIDENARYWQTAIKHPEIRSWHELYIRFELNPLAADVHDFDVWISPEGKFWGGTAHAVAARQIVQLCYGIVDEDEFHDAESILIGKGWIKATRSAMWPYYVKDNKKRCWKTTKEAHSALIKYCTVNNLEIPKNILYTGS